MQINGRRVTLAAAAAVFAFASTTAAATAAQAAPTAQRAASAQISSSQVITPANTAAQAVTWFKSRSGSTAYEGYCEKAVRLAWNRTTHHASAIAHWQSSDGARHTTGTPPKGAFVFWNISAYGHVGVADGSGGFWSTSVQGKIGHETSVHYFSNYLGWKPGNSN